MPSAPTPRADQRDDTVSPTTLLRRWWAPLAAALLVGASLGLLVAETSATVYSTTVRVLVGPVVPDADVLRGAAQSARTYGEIVESRQVIEDAVRDAVVDLDPRQVDVAAYTTRDGATIDIHVRAPSTATPQIAAALVERLRSIVEESRRQVAPVPAGPADEGVGPQLVLSGTSVVVIDDGGPGPAQQSIDPADRAIVGAAASALVLLAVALGVETRRRARPTTDLVVHHLGADLGRLHLPPRVADRRRRRSSFRLCTDERAAADALDAAGSVIGPSPRDETLVVLVTAADASVPLSSAVVQLVSGIERPVVVVDTTGAVATAAGMAVPEGVDATAHLATDRRHLGELRVVRAARHGLDRSVWDETVARGSVVLVVIPAGPMTPDSFHWAAVGHRVVVLGARPWRCEPSLERAHARWTAAGVPVAGGVTVQHRWLSGDSEAVHASVVPRGTDPTRSDRVGLGAG